jgi:hypothetical protein
MRIKLINPLSNFFLSQIVNDVIIQWAPLNVITDYVIIRLLLSDFQRPGPISIISTKQIRIL